MTLKSLVPAFAGDDVLVETPARDSPATTSDPQLDRRAPHACPLPPHRSRVFAGPGIL